MGYNSNHSTSKKIREKQKQERLGEEKLNNQGYLMKIIEYNKTEEIIVEFQDKYKAKIKTRYPDFTKGKVGNPYHPNAQGGMIGSKYPAKVNGKITKEYFTWKNMLKKCINIQENICDEWKIFENFYEWLHGQDNFDNFINGKGWIISKDIIKDNNVYSPDTCFLVSQNVNQLFIKRELNTDVSKDILQSYKEYMENKIKEVAKKEYDKGNITKECYKAMISYKI